MDVVGEFWLSAAAEAPPALFRALSDPVRRRLMERLVAGPASTCDLARRLAIPRVNVTHHLSVLAAAGLVDLRRRHVAVKPGALTRMRRYFDLALTTAAIGLPEATQPVAHLTQRWENPPRTARDFIITR